MHTGTDNYDSIVTILTMEQSYTTQTMSCLGTPQILCIYIQDTAKQSGYEHLLFERRQSLG